MIALCAIAAVLLVSWVAWLHGRCFWLESELKAQRAELKREMDHAHVQRNKILYELYDVGSRLKKPVEAQASEVKP